MAVDPVMVADYRHAHNSNRQNAEWSWVWDQSTKQGKWVMQDEKPKQGGQGSRPREKVTLQQLEEETKKDKEERAAHLRKESARRLRNKQMQKELKEMEEEEKFRQALEERKHQIYSKRSNITAGARIKPTDVDFDDVEPPLAACEDIGEGVIRIAAQKAKEGPKPGWNSGVGPGSMGPRVGFQPASLIPPPPALPPKSRGGAAGSANTSRTTSASRVTSASSRAKGSSAARWKGGVDENEDSVLEAALRRADKGIEKAREFSFGLQGSERPGQPGHGKEHGIGAADAARQQYQGYEDDDFEDEDEDAGIYEDQSVDPIGYPYSGRTSPASVYSHAPSSVAFWNNKNQCGSEGGGPRESDRTSLSSAHVGAGGYKRKVDALKDQIQGLKKQVDSPMDTSRSSRKPSPTPSSRSARSALSTACSSRTAQSRVDGTPGRVGSGRNDSGSGASSSGSNRDGSSGSILMRRRGQTPPTALNSRYGSPPEQVDVPKPFQLEIRTDPDGPTRPPSHLARQNRWAQATAAVPVPTGAGPIQSKVRQGLRAARQQAAMMDSLDLDSPAHRIEHLQQRHLPSNVDAQGPVPQTKVSLESLDLSSSGQLGGAVRADMWLKQAVQSALGADMKGPQRPTVEARPASDRNRFGFRGAGTQKSSATSRGPSAGGSRGAAPSAGVKDILRKSGELLKKHSENAKELLADHRKNKLRSETNQASSARVGYGTPSAPPSRGQSARAASQRGGRTPAVSSRQNIGQLVPQPHYPQPQQSTSGPSSRPAVMNSVAIDEEERALLKSLARLDRRLMMAADPAAAYVAAQERMDAEVHVTAVAESRREPNLANVPAHRIQVVQAPVLDHWNRREELVAAGVHRQGGITKGLVPSMPGGRDRRICNTKNK